MSATTQEIILHVPPGYKADRAVWWLVVFVPPGGGQVQFRLASVKTRFSTTAAEKAFGHPPSANLRCFDLTSRIDEARKLERRIRRQFLGL